MDHPIELEETFKPVVASNERMTQNIINELAPISERLVDIRKNEVSSRPKIGSKHKLVSSNGPLTGAFPHKHINGDVDMMFGIRLRK